MIQGKLYTALVMYFLLISWFTGCLRSEPNGLPELSDPSVAWEDITIFPGPVKPDTLHLIPEQIYRDTGQEIIGRIGAFEVDHNGRVYVADPSRYLIHVFNSNGTWISSIGREGSGPGEFRYIQTMKVTMDKLIAVDGLQSKANVFQLYPLEFEKTVNLNVQSTALNDLNGARPGRYIIRNDESFLAGFTRIRTEADAAEQRRIPYYLIDSNGLLMPYKILEVNDLIFMTAVIDGNLRAATFPFTPKTVITLSESDDIYYTPSTSDFMITVLTPEATHLRSFYYPFENVPLNRDLILNEYSHEIHQRLIQQALLPDTWPALNNLLIDDENRLWVSTIVEDFDIYRWWVLEETGELIARFDWPRAEPIEVVRNGFVYTRETDPETDIQQIVRYRIELEES